MQKKPIESWGEFQQKIQELKARQEQVHRSRSHGTVAPALLYRGQQNACWHLQTTLERQLRSDRDLAPNAPADFPAADYLQTLYCIKDEIEIRTGRNWPMPELSDAKQTLRESLDCFPPPLCEFMAYLRHHNFPSPFLDWTASPYVAAYFAFKGIPPGVKEVAIYAYLEFDEEVRVREQSAARIGSVGPTIKAHARHFSQQSQYTFCRKKHNRDDHDWDWVYASHEEAFGPNGQHESDSLWKITIPASERKIVLEYLEQHNVTALSLFHSDESLMETLAIREFTLGR
jgi:hypothetical protein